MKIFIDVTVLTMATFVTGIQRVTREISIRLLQNSSREIVLLHYNASKASYYRIDNTAYLDYYVNGNGIKEKMITKKIVPLEEIGVGSLFFDLDAAWMCRMKRSYLLPILKEQGAVIIAHIYDIISITHPQFCLERGVYNFMDFLGAHLQYADKIIVNAKATVKELERLTERLECKLPECYVVPLGADFKEEPGGCDALSSKETLDLSEDKPYVLMVGTIEPRKNHRLLLEAYDTVLKEKGFQIVFAGYWGWNMEDFEKKVKEHPDFGKGVYHFSGLKDNQINYLYKHAACLAFCSYTEGFGLPIIEALQRGTLVVSADVEVLREVGKEDCLWFEQDNPEDLCDKICKAYEQKLSQKETGRAVEYKADTWEECYLNMYKVLTNEC